MFKKITSLILTFVLVFSMIGCSNSDNSKFNLKTVKQFVFPKYNSSYLTTLAMQELQKAYEEKTGKIPKLVKDNADVEECEILVGRTNRTTANQITDANSYSITWENKKLMVNGGSVKAVNTAINHLTEMVAKGKYVLKSNITGSCLNDASSVGDYNEIVTDNFDGTAISDLWHKYMFRNDISYDTLKVRKNDTLLDTENLIAVADGKLYQRLEWRDTIEADGVKEYKTARPKISTMTSLIFQFGYTEISAKVASGNGFGCSFWLHGKGRYGLDWNYPEFDILEIYGNPTRVNITPYVWNYQSNEGSVYFDTPINSGWEFRNTQAVTLEENQNWGEEFHTFGLEWDENYYKFVIDGEIVKSVKYTDMPDDFPLKKGITKQDMIDGYRQPVYAIIDCGIGHLGWEALPMGIADITKNNFIDDNIYTIDYFTLYQKPGQLSGKTFYEVESKMD